MDLLEKFAQKKKKPWYYPMWGKGRWRGGITYSPKKGGKQINPGINQCGEKGGGAGGGVLHTHRFCVFEKFRTISSGYN
jgi:hypothetical protein